MKSWKLKNLGLKLEPKIRKYENTKIWKYEKSWKLKNPGLKLEPKIQGTLKNCVAQEYFDFDFDFDLELEFDLVL